MKGDHLEIIDLWHKYGSSSSSTYSLKSFNLSLSQGELVGLVGPSGCGKTTLLRLIAGFESPDKGKIILSGNEISNSQKVLPPESRGVGMVFQDFALFPHLNVWRNICFGLKRGFDPNRPKWLLDLLGISELASRFPHELSGGQKQRVALARALAPSPSIVLLDEPFNSLDLQVRLRLRSELSSVLKSCSATGIFVTHDSSEALAICDQVAVMRNGVLLQLSEPSKLIHNPINSFVGEFISQKNVLPIKYEGDQLVTPIGILAIKNYIENCIYDLVMFEPSSLSLDLVSPHNATVKTIEFCKDHYILTIKVFDFILRVNQPIDHSFSIGDNCKVSFRSNQDILLFPGAVKSFLV